MAFLCWRVSGQNIWMDAHSMLRTTRSQCGQGRTGAGGGGEHAEPGQETVGQGKDLGFKTSFHVCIVIPCPLNRENLQQSVFVWGLEITVAQCEHSQGGDWLAEVKTATSLSLPTCVNQKD